MVIAGKPDEAKTHFDAAIDLAPNATFAKWLAIDKATQVGDIDLLLDPTLPISAELRAGLLNGYRARTSGDAGTKAQAVEALQALTGIQQTEVVARLLADLGGGPRSFPSRRPDCDDEGISRTVDLLASQHAQNSGGSRLPAGLPRQR